MGVAHPMGLSEYAAMGLETPPWELPGVARHPQRSRLGPSLQSAPISEEAGPEQVDTGRGPSSWAIGGRCVKGSSSAVSKHDPVARIAGAKAASAALQVVVQGHGDMGAS